MEDMLRPRKERRISKVIFEALRDNHNYKGSDRTIRNFVNERKAALQIEEEKFIEGTHKPGTAQVDFGTTGVILNGKLQDISVLNVSFPYSNAGFFVPLPAENQECFFHGLGAIFSEIGGVPTEILFDNLSAAVITNQKMKGRSRQLTDGFSRLKSHFNFKAKFCAPRKGNEKGSIEAKVGYSRRNFLLPFPIINALDDLTELLIAEAWGNLEREHYKKKVLISELWEDDQKHLLPLPNAEFVFEELTKARVNKYCKINFQNETYDLPSASVGEHVLIKVTWDSLSFYNREGTILQTLPRHYTGRTKPIDWKSYFEIFVTKPGGVSSSSLYPFIPKPIQRFLEAAPSGEYRNNLKLIRDFLNESYSIDEIANAIEALGNNAYSEALLRHVLYEGTAGPSLEALNEEYTPGCAKNYKPVLELYDQLLHLEGGEKVATIHPGTV